MPRIESWTEDTRTGALHPDTAADWSDRYGQQTADAMEWLFNHLVGIVWTCRTLGMKDSEIRTRLKVHLVAPYSGCTCGGAPCTSCEGAATGAMEVLDAVLSR